MVFVLICIDGVFNTTDAVLFLNHRLRLQVWWLFGYWLTDLFAFSRVDLMADSVGR